MNKKTRRYEIHQCVKDTWVFHVEASSKKEALLKFNSHSPGVEQNCSLGAWSYKKEGVYVRRILPRKGN